MKKTFRKNIIRTIRSTASRFWAIFAIVALGVGFLAGLLSATPDMRYSGDLYFDQTRLFDLRVTGTSASPTRTSRHWKRSDVESVMPAYSADLLMDTPEGDTVVTRIHSLPDGELDSSREDWLNQFTLVEGRLPEGEGECVVEAGSALAGNPAKIGDKLTVSADIRIPKTPSPA